MLACFVVVFMYFMCFSCLCCLVVVLLCFWTFHVFPWIPAVFRLQKDGGMLEVEEAGGEGRDQAEGNRVMSSEVAVALAFWFCYFGSGFIF